jgi:DNA-binding winged helix-turn-helix (wHTH) protein/tetratricopeptide (TPR) repeat protein
MQEQGQFLFGPFRLDLTNESLWRERKQIRLHPKAFALLRYLAEHAGQTVSKETLLQAVWPNVYVTDAVLSVYIAEVRKALGDEPKEAKFIDTMHRRGYRFIAAIKTVRQPASTGTPPDSEATKKPMIREAATMIGSRPLVGREKEVAFLQERLGAVLQGNGNVVLITGQAGIGKTRLVRELRGQAERQGCKWFEGKYEKTASQAYGPWTDIIRRYLSDSKDSPLQGLAQTQVRQLAKIVPELAGEKGGTVTRKVDPDSARFELFDAITQFFIQASHHSPLILFVDDLQWAPSIELLQQMARNIGNQRILLLAAFRDDELQEKPNLSQTLLAMNRERLFHPLPLAPLGHEDVAQLLSQTVGGLADSQLVEIIYAKSEGNPFFVEEILRLLQEQNALVPGENGLALREAKELRLPESVKAVIKEHLQGLGENVHDTLQMASVIGRQFSLRLLQNLSGQDEEALVDMMDRCLHAGLIVEDRTTGEEAYGFTHDLMQEALYESIGPARRKRHHLRAAQSMEKLYAGRLEHQYDALAHHFFEGSDLAKAVQYGERAALRTFSVHSYRKAAQLLEQVIEAQTLIDPANRAKRCELLLSLGSALAPAGDPKRVADEVAPEALKLAEQLEDRQRASDCCQMALEALERYGGSAITRSSVWSQWAERASRYAAPGTNQKIVADLALARVYFGRHQWPEARNLVVRANELAHRLTEPEMLFTVNSHMMLFPNRLSLTEELMSYPRDGVSAVTLSKFLRRAQCDFLIAGQRSRAEEAWYELDQLISRTNDTTVLHWPVVLDGLRALLDGRLEDVAKAKTRIIARADELGIAAEGRLVAQHLSFRPLLYLGRFEEALADLPQAERMAGTRAFSSTMRFGWGALCLAHMGRLDEAQEQLSQFIRELKISAEEDGTPKAILATLLEIAVLVKNREAIAILSKRLNGATAIHGGNIFLVNVGRSLGRAAALLENRQSAREYFSRSLDWATKIRFRPEIALTRFEIAKLLLSEARDATGSQSAAALRSEGQTHLDFAINEFQAMKMRPALEQALHHRSRLKA